MPCGRRSSAKKNTLTSAPTAAGCFRKTQEGGERNSAQKNAGRPGITGIPIRQTGRTRRGQSSALCAEKNSLRPENTATCENTAAVPARIAGGQRKGKNMKQTLEEKLDGVINDSVNHPSHYTYGSIEVIDVIEGLSA